MMTDSGKETDKDSLTLWLGGKVSLSDFAKAVSNLSAMLREIERDITGKNEIDWLVTDLRIEDDEGGAVRERHD